MTPYQNLIAYIEDARKSGFNDQDIYQKLLSSGWKDADIQNAFTALTPQDTPSDNAAKHLGYALTLNVVGFGVCFGALTSSNELVLIFAALIYMLAGFFAVRTLVDIYFDTAHGLFYKIFMVLLALVFGGWGIGWGITGVVMMGNI